MGSYLRGKIHFENGREHPSKVIVHSFPGIHGHETVYCTAGL